MTTRLPDSPPRRNDRKTCPTCAATAAGCRSNEWLRGRRCCTVCIGDHDLTREFVKATNA